VWVRIIFFKCALNDYCSASSYLLNLHFKFNILRFLFLFLFFLSIQPLLIPPPGGTYQPPPQKNPTQPYNWRPVKWVDERHPKIAAMMEPFLTKFRGRCSVSNILKAGNKRFDSLPGLDAYPTGICWLHSIALRPYGTQCSFY